MDFEVIGLALIVIALVVVAVGTIRTVKNRQGRHRGP